MNKFYLAAPLFFLFSCYQENHYESNNDELLRKIDSLQIKVNELNKESKQTHSRDSVIVKENKSEKITESPTKKDEPSPKKIIRQTPPSLTVAKIPDSIVHKYDNGKKSVVEGSFKNDKKKITLYNKKGEITYVFEDVRSSYQISTSLKFREDGSVESANIHLNPGASINWYETKITFDNDNNPLVKIDTEMPLSLEKMMNENPWFWNTTKKEWYRQEIVREMNTPSK